MTARLLEHFDRVSEARGAVPRLRRFILDLAVRGKLVAQEPSDDPAITLVKSMHAARERLVENGLLRRSASSASLQPEETPFEVPNSWVWIRVGEGFLYDAGTKRDPKDLNPDWWLLELEDIEKDTSCVLTRRKVRERDSRSTKSEFQIGDILYGKLRPYLNKVVVADTAGYSTTEIVAIRPIVPLCSGYCSIAFRCPDFVRYVTELGRGTKMPRLRTPDAVAAPFPLPPLVDQHRIVAKVDELMALCDRLEAAQAEREARRAHVVAACLQRLNDPAKAQQFREDAQFSVDHFPRLISRVEHLKVLRETILNIAVRGRLLEQDAAEGSVSELLRSSDLTRQATARDDRRADSEPMPLLAGEERWSTPDSWEWRALADLALFIDYRGQTPTKTNEGVRLITAKNIKKGWVTLSPEEFVSDEGYERWMKRGLPSAGDVLFTTEAPMGSAAVVRLTERFALAQRVICFRLYGALDANFLVLQLLAQPFQSILEKTATGLTAKGIKAAKLKRLPVAVPPLGEQRRIVAKVDELTAVCDRLEAQLAARAATSTRLLESLLHEALADPHAAHDLDGSQPGRIARRGKAM